MIIAIAKDEAFNFTYRANIDAMRAEGEVVFFSPMRDCALPHCDMLYLPGGYPELFTDELVANESMRQSIKDYAESGGRIYGECGGLMYLCQDIDDKAMCRVLPLHATMKDAHLHLGYRQLAVNNEQLTVNNYLRGHEFHYSQTFPMNGRREGGYTEMPDDIIIIEHQSSAQGHPVPTAIFHYKNVLAGYTHWYWAERGWSAFISSLYNILADNPAGVPDGTP